MKGGGIPSTFSTAVAGSSRLNATPRLMTTESTQRPIKPSPGLPKVAAGLKKFPNSGAYSTKKYGMSHMKPKFHAE